MEFIKLIETDDSDYWVDGVIYLHFSVHSNCWLILEYVYNFCLSRRMKTDSVIRFGQTWKGVKSLMVVLYGV